MHDLSTTRPDGLLLSRLVHGRKPKKRWDGSYLFSSSRGRFHRFSVRISQKMIRSIQSMPTLASMISNKIRVTQVRARKSRERNVS